MDWLTSLLGLSNYFVFGFKFEPILYYQENMSAKTIERPLILNLGFKVVKFDDL